MKVSELRGQTPAELKALLAETRLSQMKQRLKISGAHSSAHHVIRQTRRDIARIKTIVRQKDQEKE